MVFHSKDQTQLLLALWLIALPLLLFFPGCKGVEGKEQRLSARGLQKKLSCPTPSEVEPRHVLLILCDRSGSVLDGSGMICTESAKLLPHLPSSTLILGRFVSSRSYSDTETFLTDAIPQRPSAPNCTLTNPFDPRQRRLCYEERLRYKAQIRCVEEARERIATSLKNLKPTRSSHTDLWGALAAAAEILAVYPQSQRTLLIYSDLHDTVGTPLPNTLPGLKGVRVIACTAKNHSPTEMARRKEVLRRRLLKWGATPEFRPLGTPLRDGLFK